MPLYRIQTALQDVSRLPRDQYVNTLFVTRPTAPDWTAVDGALHDIYDAISTFYNGMTAYLSRAIDYLADHTIKIYDVAAPLGSPPVASTVFRITVPGSSSFQSLPNEVACCLTYHAVPHPGAGWFPQSWRGRLYIGPLCADAAGPADAPGTGRPLLAFRGVLLNCGVALDTDLHDAGFQMVVYSRKHSWVLPVVNFGVDDAWDTQRTRGLRRTLVNTAPVSHAVPASGPA